MFPGTRGKLEDARTILQHLEAAADALTFRAEFNSFLSAARSVTYAMQKEGANVGEFAEWYAEKQEEMRQDELLRFVHDARIEDFHKGKHRLQFATEVESFSSAQAGPKPAPDATMTLGAEGIYWRVDAGTPQERRVPIRAGKFVTKVSIQNPPRTHQGTALQRNDPLTICRLVLRYFENLIHEATTVFATEAE